MVDARVDIDAIVFEVMRRLKSGGETAASAEGAAPAAAPHQTAGDATGGQLIIEDRVVALATIQERLDAVRRIVLRPGAIVTPSARDELRRRNIALAYRGDAPPLDDAPGLLAGVAAASSLADELLRTIELDGTRVERIEGGSLAGTLGELIPRTAAGPSPALLLTDQPAAALCAANRNRGVRAAWGGDAASVAEAVRAIGANLLVIDPAGRSVFELRRIVIEFAGDGRRECPAPLRELLEEGSL